ncbi:MAG: lysine--tRNA ligase, partial [Clostridia bacterium]|nr:lysine--tRNA ligase [Clostridia bacterium]
MADNNQKKQNAAPEQDTNSLRQIRIDKLHAMQEAGNDPFQVMTATQTAKSMEIKNNYEDFEDREVSICGRMIARRIMGKASFAQIQDREGNIQIYVSRDDLGVDDYQAFKKAWDIGDILEVTGKVFKTKTGEISVHATHAKLLSKSLLPLPEKFHGLTDVETRFRQRYVDLIVNPEVRRNFEIRTKFVSHIRRYLDNRGFMEVETPVLNTISGGATARPFITHHNTLDIDMYMRIATELHLKRLIVGGLERVY